MTWRMLLFIPAVLAGILVFRVLQPEPGTDSGLEVTQGPQRVPVEAMPVTERPIDIAVEGFGRVEPDQRWEGVSQVDGRVIATIADLAEGTIVTQGAELLRIDPRSYEIARDRAAANLDIARADLAELNARVSSLQEQLTLEREIEAVIQADVDRRLALIERGASASSTMDQARRDLLSQQWRVLDLENQLDLIPVQRSSAEATVRTREVELEDAERSLANTVITAPFTGRVLEEDAAVGEYIRVGEPLVTLAGLTSVEVVAEMQPSDVAEAFQLLVPDLGAMLQEIDLQDQDTAIQALRAAGLTPLVSPSEREDVIYPADIVRIDGTLDEATGTIGLVVRVTQDGRPNLSNRRPPLPNGAFVRVRLRATTEKAWLSVPRDALRTDGAQRYVYVADADDTLARRAAELLGRANGDAVIDAELQAGDRIIVIPPSPAIIGQPLEVMLPAQATTQ